jgi:hypothetical protein
VRGAAFIAIGLLLLHALAYVVRTKAPDGTAFLLQIEQRQVGLLNDNLDVAQAVVVGNSHGDDIDSSYIGYRGYQLSRAWGDLFETKSYLTYFVPRMPQLKVVFIPISYFSFSWDNGAAEKLGMRRQQFYHTQPSWQFIAGDFENFVRAKTESLFPVKTILREDNWKSIFYAFLQESDPGSENDAGVIARECDYLEADELGNVGRLRALEQIELAAEIADNHPDIHQETYTTLVELIAYLHDRDVRIIFFTPPYSREYARTYQTEAPEQIALMYRNMVALQRDFAVEYYDFAHEEQFVSDHRLFADSDHLNVCGKRLFTQMFSGIISNQALSELGATE